MKMFMARPVTDFFYKLFHWEFWPFEIVYLPVILYWLYLSIKARSLLFFTASNPSIDTGGMLGESKDAIYKLVPEDLIPKTEIVQPSKEISLDWIIRKGFNFPLIVKPNVGERGTGVEKVQNLQELNSYSARSKSAFLIQEFVDFPLELGVFFYKIPGTVRGRVTSVTIKDYLKVLGDGICTVKQLIEKSPRARFQLKRLLLKERGQFGYIPKQGECVILEQLGNHCRGATFFNGESIIDDKLNHRFNEIANRIPGFYYGRFDIKCSSIEGLKEGKNFKILELNGAGAEPSHIYHPGFSLLKGWKVLLDHWNVLYKISILNHQKGIPYMSVKEGFIKWKSLKRARL